MTKELPDVIVIGAGVIGLFTAWELANAGLKVQLVERGLVGREASWAGGGILSPLHPWLYPEPVLALADLSQAAYPTICQQLAADTGIDPGWVSSGLLIQEPHSVEPARDWAVRRTYPMEVLDVAEQSARFPALPAIGQALWLASVAQVRNPRLVKALAAMLVAKGVTLHQDQPVQSILVDAGRVRGVRTFSGQDMPSAQVVLAAGAWSAQLLPDLLRIRPVKGQMLLYSTASAGLPVIALRDETYLIPRGDGHILVGSSMEEAGYDKTPSAAIERQLHAAACVIFPALSGAHLVTSWAGLRPASPDGIPIVAEVPGIAGLFVNTGHFRHGLLTAPASARLLADVLLRREPGVNASDYALDRPIGNHLSQH